jgi:hypothetical protein
MPTLVIRHRLGLEVGQVDAGFAEGGLGWSH